MNKAKELLQRSGYSDKAIDYYLKKTNVGDIKNPDAFCLYMGPCGDSMELYLKVENGIIKDAKFQGTGCAAAFSSASAITKMIKNKSIDEANKISEKDVIEYLGDVPKPKRHCTRLVVNALRRVIEDYYSKQLNISKS